MIRLIYAADLFRRPLLAASMFRDRAIQFCDQLGWDVCVDDCGHEFDQYDDLNPVYVILENDGGSHLASARLLPTTGRTMLNEQFRDLADGVEIRSPLIWETTRFCLSPKAQGDVQLAVRGPAAIMWAGCELALRSGIEFYTGVFDAEMLEVYDALGWSPEVLGTRRTDQGQICAGLWEVTPQVRDQLARRAGFAGCEPKVQYFPTVDRFHTAGPIRREEEVAAGPEILVSSDASDGQYAKISRSGGAGSRLDGSPLQLTSRSRGRRNDPIRIISEKSPGGSASACVVETFIKPPSNTSAVARAPFCLPVLETEITELLIEGWLTSIRDMVRAQSMYRLAEHLDDAILVAASEFYINSTN